MPAPQPQVASDGVCPLTVAHPLMLHRWELLTFVHYPYPVDLVQSLLPRGLTVEPFDGQAWVGLVPFFMRVRPPLGGSIPWVSRFCETNVRTYVQDARGRSGVWFFSLDAARLGAVATARLGFGLPYYWAAMELRLTGSHGSGSTVTYTCRRRGPGREHPTSRVSVTVGSRLTGSALTTRDHFLTARWRLFAHLGGRLLVADAAHAPWPLFRAQLTVALDELVPAAGLPPPGDAPLVHYSPGVDVRIGGLRPVTAEH